jgi:Fic family protein
MNEHIRESNLIEGIDSDEEDRRSLRAWNWAVGNIDSAFTTGFVLELHRRITLKQLPKNQRGHWRKAQVWVGNHTPPSPFVVVSMISQHLDTLRSSWKDLDPKTMHIQFETIHPFIDGNGRTGRMLMWLHEVRQGKEPTLLKAAERQDYYSWFNRARLIKGREEI